MLLLPTRQPIQWSGVVLVTALCLISTFWETAPLPFHNSPVLSTRFGEGWLHPPATKEGGVSVPDWPVRILHIPMITTCDWFRHKHVTSSGPIRICHRTFHQRFQQKHLRLSLELPGATLPPWGEKVSEDGAKKKQVELRDKEYKTPDGFFWTLDPAEQDREDSSILLDREKTDNKPIKNIIL